MNRALILAILIVALLAALIGADVILVADTIEKATDILASAEKQATEKADSLQRLIDDNRLLLSASVPLSQLYTLEEAVKDLAVAAQEGDPYEIRVAHGRASLALSQIKRSALFSKEQIL